MNSTYNKEQVSEILNDLAESIDIPPSKYKEAKEHYEAVGKWLDAKDSDLSRYVPQVYPQGSFALGTAVRPLGEDEYDVDAVCLLSRLTADDITQKQLKEIVGARLKHPGSRYKEKIEPSEGGWRCWKIQYADESQFHLDILPSVPDFTRWFVGLNIPEGILEHTIRLTDKRTPEYPTGWPERADDPTRSNPKGYAIWFRKRMEVRLTEAKTALAREKRASIEEIADYEVRTPLQRAVQILKRHRDVRYNGDENKPISVIITTLAARSYSNETELYEAVMSIVPGMRRHIEKRNGVWWVENPVNPLENFADKWNENPRKAEIFFEWLDAIEAEYQHIITDDGIKKIGSYLAESYGRRDAMDAIEKYASRHGREAPSKVDSPVVLLPRIGSDSPEQAYPNVNVSKPIKPWQP